MGEYSKIQKRIWNSPTFNQLSDEAKYLWLYILTCPHGNLLGLFVLKPGYVCEDLKWLPEQFHKPFKELLNIPLSNGSDKGLVSYDQTTGVLLIKNYLEHNPLANPNQVKAAIKKLEELPFSKIFQEFKQLLKRLNKPLYKPLLEWLDERLGKWYGKPVTVTITESISESINKDLNINNNIDNNTKNSSELKKSEQKKCSELETSSISELVNCSCPEKDKQPLLTIPLIHKKKDGSSEEYPIYQTDIDEWSEAYPAVDVLQALHSIRQWNLANPKKRKTRTGIRRHIVTWLARVQDKGGNKSVSSKPSLTTTQFSEEFKTFLSHYPRVAAPLAAWNVWQKLESSGILPPLDQLLQAIEQQQQSEQWRQGFIPEPAKWLKEGRWEDKGVVKEEIAPEDEFVRIMQARRAAQKNAAQNNPERA